MKRANTHKEHIDRLNTAISVENLTVAHGEQPVLWNVNFTVPENTTMAIIGPTKAGKSTLLKTILGFIKPTAGKVYIYSRPTGTLKNDIAWIPERSSINWKFPTTVYDIANMGSYNRSSKNKDDKRSNKDMVESALTLTNLADYRKYSISDLTHSQQQCLLIARALVQNSRIFIMDEPFFSADEKSKDIIINILNHLKSVGKTVVVTHNDVFTIPLYYDMTTLINVKLIACGDTKDIVTEENLKNTYSNKTNFIKIASMDNVND